MLGVSVIGLGAKNLELHPDGLQFASSLADGLPFAQQDVLSCSQSFMSRHDGK